MEKVKDTKNPTVKQLQNIAGNLEEKFGKYSTAKVVCQAFTASRRTNYRIYIEHFPNTRNFKSWQELLSFYHKLMKEKS